MNDKQLVHHTIMPCPFCGGTKINISECGTFRWRRAECQECEAMAGPVRIQTTGDGTDEEWEKAAADEAFKRWNERRCGPLKINVARELDPVEDALIRQAASDCLTDLRQLAERGAVTRFVQSGNDVLRVRVSVVNEHDKTV